MSKNKKENLIQKSDDMSQVKVKSYEERLDNTNNVVSRGKDITFNKL
ncbi:hypothetical protein [uncultured Clostridium sp.]|nr:hypothetical protein [uncultured Clostridium sp.]